MNFPSYGRPYCTSSCSHVLAHGLGIAAPRVVYPRSLPIGTLTYRSIATVGRIGCCGSTDPVRGGSMHVLVVRRYARNMDNAQGFRVMHLSRTHGERRKKRLCRTFDSAITVANKTLHYAPLCARASNRGRHGAATHAASRLFGTTRKRLNTATGPATASVLSPHGQNPVSRMPQRKLILLSIS